MKCTKLMVTILAVMLMSLVTSVFGFVSIPITRMQNAVHAYPPGTATGLTIQNAYDYLTSSDRDARMGTIGVLNRRTLILTPGTYTSTAIVLDTDYVDIVGIGVVIITDTSGAVIDCDSKITRISNVILDASSIANGLTNDTVAVVENVTIIDGTDEVIYVTGVSGTYVYDTTDSGFSTSPVLIGATPIVLEGATVNAFETSLAVTDPTADLTWTFPNGATDIFAFMGSTLITNIAEAANSVWGVSNGLTFEGATANDFETTISPVDPTADRTLTIPNKTGIVLMGSAASVITPSATPTLTIGLSNIYTNTPTDNEDQTITFSAGGNNGDELTIIFTSVSTGDEVITFEATLVSTTGTLTIGTTAAKFFTIKFISDGSHWYEVSRTAEQT